MCLECGELRLVANVLDLHTKSGAFYDHWRRRSYLAAVRMLLDDPDARG